jgi:hypothetical protein
MIVQHKYIKALFLTLVTTFAFSCVDEITNPSIGENEIRIYLLGSGASVSQLGWQGYDVEVGDSLRLELQVSPKNETNCKWINANNETISSDLVYTYKPLNEENIQVRFVATRTNGYADTITFKLNAGIPGSMKGDYGVWNNQLFEQGTLTGQFDAYFTLTPTGNLLNSAAGLGSGNASTYANLSCIIRFNNTGKIDVFKGTDAGGGYVAETDFQYEANNDYNFKVSVDLITQTYSVYLLQNAVSTTLASNYLFRAKSPFLNTWSIFSDGVVKGNGILKMKNKSITVISQNYSPRFETISPVKMDEGKVLIQNITVVNPLSGVCTIKAIDLPRFATFTDNKNNTATLKYSPYANCGGCDVGVHTVKLQVSNSEKSAEITYTVEVSAASNKLVLEANTADAEVYEANLGVVSNLTTMSMGKIGITAASGGFGNSVVVIPFEIPHLQAGMEVKSAVLNVFLEWNRAWQNVRYDLYALPYRTAATALSSDYYVADGVDVTSGVSLIKSSFIQNYSLGDGTLGKITLDATASAQLATFINQQITNGATAGKYFFLRINANRADLNSWIHAKVASAETANKPMINITFGAK